MSDAYWDRPEWPEQLQRTIEAKSVAWEKDWGLTFAGIADRCHITLSEAMLFYICHQVAWWTIESVQFQHDYAPIVAQMRKELGDLKRGDDWKGEGQAPTP